MKKNSLYKILKESGLGFAFVLCISQNGHAQFSNNGDVKVSESTIVSLHTDYINNPSSKFVNDGLVHVFQNWNNDGEVSYTVSLNGKTFFTGTEDQIIEGLKTSDFQNVIFENANTKVPFHLGGEISVGNKAEFIKGIIDAAGELDKVIFKENAVHTGTSDLSFVDGKVQKLGQKAFEFPVGNKGFFRPSYHAVGVGNNVYTTQYFYENSNDSYDHMRKDSWNGVINNQEYWSVTQEDGADKIVLSLTMRNETTPSEFLSPPIGKQVVIVRWDGTKGWVNEGGLESDYISNEPYDKLVTATVTGYGIFTLALVDKDKPADNELVVYNGVSPNGDGKNDSFLIKGIDKYPDNEVEIYNRWGVKVFGTKSYNETDNMFRGYSDGRATVSRGDKLPTGTYFYILKYNKDGKGIEKSGYLYINNQ